VISAQEGDSLSLTCLQILPNDLVNDGAAEWSVLGSNPANSFFKVHSVTKDSGNLERTQKSETESENDSNTAVATRSIVTDPLERSDDPLRFTCQSGDAISDDVIVGATFVDVDVVYPPTFTIRRVPAFGVPVVEGMRISMVLFSTYF